MSSESHSRNVRNPYSKLCNNLSCIFIYLLSTTSSRRPSGHYRGPQFLVLPQDPVLSLSQQLSHGIIIVSRKTMVQFVHHRNLKIHHLLIWALSQYFLSQWRKTEIWDPDIADSFSLTTNPADFISLINAEAPAFFFCHHSKLSCLLLWF